MRRIYYQVEDEIAVITLDDGKANAMNHEFFSELSTALDQAEGDGAGAIIFTGRVGFFSAGLDLKFVPTLAPQALREFRETFARVMLRVYSFSVPTLAALEGHAIAGGAILAFSCDLRFAINGPYRIQMNEVAIGLPLPSWMALVCYSAIPSRWRTEALLHARAYSPQEAFERGIIDELVERDGDIMNRAKGAAVELLKLNRLAYATTKRRIREPEIHRGLELLKGEQSDTFDVSQRSKP